MRHSDAINVAQKMSPSSRKYSLDPINAGYIAHDQPQRSKSLPHVTEFVKMQLQLIATNDNESSSDTKSSKKVSIKSDKDGKITSS